MGCVCEPLSIDHDMGKGSTKHRVIPTHTCSSAGVSARVSSALQATTVRSATRSLSCLEGRSYLWCVVRVHVHGFELVSVDRRVVGGLWMTECEYDNTHTKRRTV